MSVSRELVRFVAPQVPTMQACAHIVCRLTNFALPAPGAIRNPVMRKACAEEAHEHTWWDYNRDTVPPIASCMCVEQVL